MPFPFTFNLTVPGLSNPFAAAVPTTPDADNANTTASSSSGSSFVQIKTTRQSRGLAKINRPRPSPSRSPAPTSKKRGWEPSFAEPSHSATTRAFSGGYLDTPAKYRQELDSMSATDLREVEDMMDAAAELPPAKRRRGLAGSIVSTALSAALIGTAVGLTVYRLWRDRGKEQEQLPPPPPYQQEWVVASGTQHEVKVTPPTPRRKHRHAPSLSTSKRAAARRPRIRGNTFSAPAHRSVSPSPLAAPFQLPAQPHTQPEFDFEGEPEPEVTEQMDWIGDKLSALIEEGKKALGREVVVMSDAQEDEIDDGTGDWEEDYGPPTDNATAGPSGGSASASRPVSRQGSVRRRTAPRRINIAATHAIYPTASMSSNPPSASAASSYQPPRSAGSDEGMLSSRGFKTEDERSWESAEMRELMERARAKALQKSRGLP